MNVKPTVYFGDGGPQHSIATLRAAKERALELKPTAVIVTSSTGATALEAARIFEGTGIRLIGAPFQRHLWDRHRPLDPDIVTRCREFGVEFLPDEPRVPMLGEDRPDIVNAWRVVSQGFKVAVQMAAMCVDTGMIEAGALVISLGGSSRGADTAIVVRPQGTANVLKSKVVEIIAMPSAARGR